MCSVELSARALEAACSTEIIIAPRPRYLDVDDTYVAVRHDSSALRVGDRSGHERATHTRDLPQSA